MLPNFFIAGAPKAGTTSLFHYLEGHPEVFMCPVKEPNFFSVDEIIKQNLYYAEKGVRDRREYEQLFAAAGNAKAVGEASVSYLFYESAPYKIKEAVPEAKIIIILRNPVDRAFSHYLMDSRLGYVDISFEDIVYKKTEHPLADLYYQQSVELGLYYRQVERYLNVFGEKQVKIFFNEDLRADMAAVIGEIYDFLGISTEFMPDIGKQYNVYREPRSGVIGQLYSLKFLRRLAKKLMPGQLTRSVKDTLMVKTKKPELSAETRQYLTQLYAPDIERLAGLLGRDLSGWLA